MASSGQTSPRGRTGRSRQTSPATTTAPPIKPPGVKDVAALAGVSVGSVSNVINRRGSVRDDVRARVERAIAQLGYVPNPTAQALRRGVSPLVGVAVFDLTNPFFMEAAAGMEQRLRDNGCVMSLASTHADPDDEATLLRALAGQAVRGILLTPADTRLDVAHELVDRGIPIVLFDCPDTPDDMSSVSIDDRAGAALAIEHLLDLGHRRILFLNGPSSVRQARQRLLGVQDAISGWRADPDDPIDLDVAEVADFTAQAGRDYMRAALDADGSGPGSLPDGFPTAIFCANDLIAFGVVGHLRERAVEIPRQISVVGFDDISIAADMSVPLTTVCQPMRELGVEAVDLLLRATDPDAPVEHRTFNPHLVVRDSSAPPAP
ncbi:LacI family transcriptional regulator [Actinomyces sp. B33]|uniref:LacI family DNA-binding transcriptional regulator n=1 Tax=Actinomyces sp. B33 TaxID=2942131 RepID=UPI0023425263|nr:LacI family DNA-binding transcriptional regulator [Actinomyces sp. B33]MDC4233416.1 LacI family transcriptional regulator [Actinomyces sp. B33]